ncbi:hypothetical protein ACH5RR_031843 [Cinchona calisaya]|uniref:Uncharacterized protein n=1 Tax=Cinchona calisaya TaxID=153742 RepID=A0ABD2YHR7_9GENT
MDVAAVNCIDFALRELRKKYYKHMGCDRDLGDCFFNSPDNGYIEAEYLGSKVEHLAEKLACVYKEEMNKNKDKEKYLAEELVQLAIDYRRRSEDLIVPKIREVIGQ